MKKIICFVCLIFCICSVSSCSKKAETIQYEQTEDDYQVYNINEDIFSFDISDNNEIYYITSVENQRYETKTDTSGNELRIPISGIQLNVLNSVGDFQKSYILPDTADKICLDGENIYYVYSKGNDSYALARYSTVTQTSVPVCDFKDFSLIKEVEIMNNELYFIGIHDDYTDLDYSLADVEDDYYNSGERIGCVDLDTGTVEDLPVDFPVLISNNPDGNQLVIYAYDEENGFYFTVYDAKKKFFSEKTYHDLGMLMNFDVYNTDNDFISFNVTKEVKALTAASISADKGFSELFPAGYIQYIKCSGDYTYFIDAENLQNIVRIKTSTYLQGNEKITMLNSSFYYNATPFGCGFTIDQRYLTDEELAINILSQDRNYDICSLHSRQTISANIRKNGSFYPLNDVKGVKEYLDSCFPYIKECATNEDGDIWMLPISVDIPFFLYNDEVCSQYGIQLSNSMKPDYFYQIINQIKQDDSLKDLYYYYPDRLKYDLFYQYLREYKTFDTDLFKILAQNIKQYDNEYKGEPEIDQGNSNLQFSFSAEGNTNIILGYIWDTMGFNSVNSTLHACNMPYLTDTKTNVATCYFLIVNPASKNLKASLQYISSLCHYLTTVNNSFIFKDRSIYPDCPLLDDIYEIYSNGDIQFTYPEELYLDDFDLYLKDEKDLESFIKDSNKRLDTFLNE